ncbi:1-(5-phosphoribosyl)-5-[(5-phosphoribosylamino)methylideneamino]imidazole-4-carboxamide isomerase [Blattabacterium cuenoti]|uniref:1-(5-phosphoribosyl)-5-[(5- phosphoribosylamino)methylideneamino]imidazole-4- carboxamide isomerase n=1 Tax=Blattabacterium cuenoti TaxID=1653831 RepID=UPI00163BFA37|nr:1-(5-phosphoribosyl)-5-[(5-phosphoribosylamino)methylideneamino]imidazole-4-carboxamide isomerase [Blattabacterium cuenoti]
MIKNHNIIVAIDLIDGKCVRLTQGDFGKKKIYNQNPLEIAFLMEDHGINRIHLVDLDGARMGQVIHWKILEKIAKNTSLVIDFGGGIHSTNDFQFILDCGANMVSIGSIALQNPILFNEWINIYGNEKILLGVDIKNEKIAINGWRTITNVSYIDFIKEQIDHGIRQIFCTDIYQDGSLNGPSFDLYKKIIQKYSAIDLIASGGIRNIQDIKKLIQMGCFGVIIGKAIYENHISFDELQEVIIK